MALPMCLAALPAMLATVLLSGLAPAAAQPTSSGIAVAVVSGTGLATSLKVKLGEPGLLGLGQSRPFCLSLPPRAHPFWLAHSEWQVGKHRTSSGKPDVPLWVPTVTLAGTSGLRRSCSAGAWFSQTAVSRVCRQSALSAARLPCLQPGCPVCSQAALCGGQVCRLRSLLRPARCSLQDWSLYRSPPEFDPVHWTNDEWSTYLKVP
jgi:hypothetical protein